MDDDRVNKVVLGCSLDIGGVIMDCCISFVLVIDEEAFVSFVVSLTVYHFIVAFVV